MKNQQTIKQALYNACRQHIEERVTEIHRKLTAIEEAQNNETKSSAGDKYETGRAMMHIETQNAKVQLAQALKTQGKLLSIKPDKEYTQVASGSLVVTDKGSYFVAIGIGKVTVEDSRYFCISPDAPIGRQLIGKTAGEEITFNGNIITIEEIH